MQERAVPHKGPLLALLGLGMFALLATGCQEEGPLQGRKASSPAPGATGTARQDPRAVLIAQYRVDVIATPYDDALAFNFKATITGGPDSTPELYCAGTTWEFGDGQGWAAIPGCVPWSPDLKLRRSYEFHHWYEQPGEYLVEFSYGPLKGSTLVRTGSESPDQ
ncbi:MAG: hypothetical protein HY532_08230 [Chloroflexi bacterium]|nr:hypothetical protein [Chloroflexota bacterium]